MSGQTDCASSFNVYATDCPARLVLDHLGDKWALLILNRLGFGPRRFNALRREIEGVSQKVLSQVLKRLERDGLVARAVFPTVPVTVEYSLTTLGSELTGLVSPLLNWAERKMPEILVAQGLFDAPEPGAMARVAPQPAP